MPVGTGTGLPQLERTWLLQRVTGATSQTPLSQLRREYYIAQVGGTFTSVHDYQKRWLRKIITDNAGTPTSTIYTSTLLKEVLAVLGYNVSPSIAQNWQTLYRNFNP